MTMTDPALAAGPLSWDVCYKLGSPRDEMKLSLSGLPDSVIKAKAGEPLGTLHHLGLQSTGPRPTLSALPLGGQAQLCGVTIETDPAAHPGVVLDTLGINGARLTTPLAWDEAAWVAELGRRPPALVILEYGTNECGDTVVDPARYLANLRALVGRVRKASPACDCAVLAPTDRADTPDRTPQVRDALRDAAQATGCMFWDTYTVMGGKGAIAAWREETPPRAAPDGVHLLARGYRELGEKLAADLLASYRP
jgi:lysophospholipase L1-like esterase